MEWINVAQERNKKRAAVNMVMKLRIIIKLRTVWNVLHYRFLSRRTLLHEVSIFED